ncbi:hypothetical protein RZS08_18595, partial [Arthrospira platensis SPKY1]|nr:hypothetical protein [Arthrospira platensis SPKY1]
MGIQAGIGNFGVSVVQFVAPWIIGFAVVGGAVGGPQLFTKADVLRGAVTVTKNEAGVVTDLEVKRAELAAAIQVERAEDGRISQIVLVPADGVKLFRSVVERDDEGEITAVKSEPGLRLDLKRNEAGDR